MTEMEESVLGIFENWLNQEILDFQGLLKTK